MMNAIATLLLLIMLPGWLSAAVVLDLHFNASEGFTDGAELNGIQKMNAQSLWLAEDTTGTGFASSSQPYRRARNFASYALEIGHSVVIETTLRLTDRDGVWADADIFRIGFAEKSVNSGSFTPSIGSRIHSFPDGSYCFGGDAPHNRISIDATDAGDWITFTQIITRIPATNAFTCIIKAYNVTDGVDLGSSPGSWTQTTTDGSWGGSMCPSFRILENEQETALEIDRWTVSTLTPVPPYPAAVTLDLTHPLSIGGFTAFDREKFITIHDTGKKTGGDGFDEEEAAYLIDTNRIRYGRSIGGFNWIRSRVTEEDPLRPGYVNTNALISYCQSHQDILATEWPWQKLGYQAFDISDHTTIFPGQSIPGRFNPGNHDAAAEWASLVWQHYWTAPRRPLYYEPINEPFVNAASIGTDEQGIIDFHLAVMDRVQRDVPGLKVGGPCSAWPVFSRNHYDHFRTRVGRFIDQVGDRTDFISWHIYSRFTDDTDLVPDSMGANADWQLDLVETYARNQTGRAIPILITEYGAAFQHFETTANWSRYTPERDWQILKSVMGKNMIFQDRPDTVEKTIPFIVGKASWYSGFPETPYPWVTYRQVEGEWIETHLPKFYGFWKHVEGDRFTTTSSDPDLQVLAYATNQTVHLCLNNLEHAKAARVNLTALLKPGTLIEHARRTRLYFNGDMPVLEEQVPVIAWNDIILQPEEASILHLSLNQAPDRSQPHYRTRHYGDRTMVAYTGTPEFFTIATDRNRGAIQKATLKIGVTRAHETPIPPLVTFNGQALTPAVDWPGGLQADRSQFDGTIRMDVPTHLVQPTNTVALSFATDGGFFSTAILDVETELPAIRPIRARVDGDTSIIDWDSSPMFEYSLMQSTNLTGAWSVIHTEMGNGRTLSVTNPASNVINFFHIKRVLK